VDLEMQACGNGREMAVIGMAQQKGGTGKTTLAVQIGVAWRASGKRVAMLDVDPQASLLIWFDRRRPRLGDDAAGLVVQGLSGWRLGSELGRLRGQVFAASIGAGRGVAESAPASPAGQEIAALAQEVLGRLR
jgi:anion-transporting  ArsA/GET3 family ATPase